MTGRSSPAIGPRKALLMLGVGGLVGAVLFAVGGVVDLNDGETWHKRSRRHGADRWVQIVQTENPKGFRTVLLVRYVMPVTILGTASLVCFLGAAAQPVRCEP